MRSPGACFVWPHRHGYWLKSSVVENLTKSLKGKRGDSEHAGGNPRSRRRGRKRRRRR